MAAISQLMPTGIPGRLYGSFAGKLNDNTIPALIYNGVSASMRHTGGLGGVSDGTSWSGVWIGSVNSDDSAMSFRSIRNANGVVFSLRRTATNTIEFKGFQSDASTAVFSCVTTATVEAADGLVAIFYGCRGTHAALAVVKSTGAAVGTNTPGTAGNIDFTADDYLGQDGASGEWLDADQSLHWGHNIWMDPHDQEWRDQFYDRATDLVVNPGATGANPLGGVTQPLMCHKGAAASATANAGSGGDADNPGVFTDGTSPGSYSTALVNGFDVALAKGAGWLSADHSANTTATGFSQLTDRLSGSVNAAQATAADQPLKTDTSGVISAEYNAGNDSMILTSASLDNLFAGGGGFLIVMRPDSDGEGDNARILDKDPDWICQVTGETAGNVIFSLQIRYSGPSMNAQTGAVISVGDIHVIDATVDTDLNDPSDIIVGLDGALLTEGDGLTTDEPSGTISGGTPDMYLGNRSDNARAFVGGFYEIILFASRPTAPEMARLRTHMGRKYGVTLS